MKMRENYFHYLGIWQRPGYRQTYTYHESKQLMNQKKILSWIAYAAVVCSISYVIKSKQLPGICQLGC